MKIAIIGAGASGCFAGANIAGTQGMEVTVFEKTSKMLQKVKVSGGGRCNVTHACFNVPELLAKYPRGSRLLRKTLYRFGPEDTLRWFADRGVTLKTEPDGRMFPVSDNSQTIIDCLTGMLAEKRVRVVFQKSVDAIERQEDGFLLRFADGTISAADRIIVATGGFPKSDQYRWLLALGHTISEPVPSLFTFNIPGHPITQLMGVAVKNASVKIAGSKIAQSGPLLITHWGVSGPAILRTSAYAARELHERDYRFSALINWLGETGAEELRGIFATIRKTSGGQLVQGRNPFDLPKRLWEFQLEKCGVSPETRWGDLPSVPQNKLIEALVADKYEVTGKTTFKEEFVTCGGITLSEINPATMESRIVPGLFFAGEIMDADGVTGGFNFQHAWSSAYIAAEAIVKS